MGLFGREIIDSGELNNLRESLADLERVAEDIGWIKVNDRGDESQDAAKCSFDEMVKRSRLAFIKNPIVGQAVALTTNYTFGEGISEPKANDGNEDVQKIISDFWNHPDNKISFTSSEPQIKISNKLQYDGELAICFKVDTDGSVYVRFIDPLSISKIIYDKSDSMRPLFYKRRINLKDQYIPDYANGLAHLRDTSDYAGLWAELLKSFSIREEQVPKNTFLYHVKINNDILDSRGVPEVYRALDWMNANSKINSDMALFINTQAQFAWKKKFKGTKSQMQAARSRIGQNTQLTNPQRGAGSVLIENEKVENEAIALPSSTGQLFEVGIRRTLLMTIAAFGMMEHYFGDPSTGNLATTTAMELPMLKKFLSRQKTWEGIYINVMNFVLDQRLLAVSYKFFDYNEMMNRITVKPKNDYEDRFIDIDFPPIIEKDIKILGEALGAAKRDQLAPIETSQRMFLQGLGVNNIEEEMKKEFEEKIIPILPGFGNQDPASAKESEKILRNFVKRAREAARPSAELSKNRQNAGKLAEKNKEVFRKMNGYAKAIGGEYRKFFKEVKESASASMGADEKYSGQVKNLSMAAKKFENGMLRAADRYLPQAADLGRSYVESRLAIKENGIVVKLVEQAYYEDFIQEQIDLNRKYVEELTPAIVAKIKEKALQNKKFDSEKDFFAEIEDAVTSMESRVGMYAGAFWTVEERAVQFVGKNENPPVAFVGVDDDKVCEGCRYGLDGNPSWTMSDVPIPGEQDCIGNCRHAIQIQGDEALTESDIDLMRESENTRFSLLSESVEAAV